MERKASAHVFVLDWIVLQFQGRLSYMRFLIAILPDLVVDVAHWMGLIQAATTLALLLSTSHLEDAIKTLHL